MTAPAPWTEAWMLGPKSSRGELKLYRFRPQPLDRFRPDLGAYPLLLVEVQTPKGFRQSWHHETAFALSVAAIQAGLHHPRQKLRTPGLQERVLARIASFRLAKPVSPVWTEALEWWVCRLAFLLASGFEPALPISDRYLPGLSEGSEADTCPCKGPARHRGQFAFCTRPRGHEGDHASHVGNLMVDRWPACQIDWLSFCPPYPEGTFLHTPPAAGEPTAEGGDDAPF